MTDRLGTKTPLPRIHRTGLALAEATAWPFADVAAFRGGYSRTNIDQLKPRLEQRLAELGASERADSLAAKVWKPEEPLDRFLTRHARKLLEAHGDSTNLVPDHDNPGEEILRWRWMSLALPPDLLIAAADPSGASSRVQLLDPTLRVLQPTAHLHVHATAVIPFTRIWTGIGETMYLRNVCSYPEGFSGRREWQAWLRRAFVARYVLSMWMREGFECIKRVVQRHSHVEHAVRDLRVGRLRSPSPLLEADLSGFVRSIEYRRRSRAHSAEPSASQDIELPFIRRCLVHLERESGNHHEWFRRLWVQMTRVRVLLYRHLVHDPARCGLDPFAKLYDRLNEYMTDRLEDDATSIAGHEPGLQVEHIELRKAPGRISKLRLLHKKSRDAERRCMIKRRRKTGCRITWILHFIRDQGASKGLKNQVARHYQIDWSLAATFRQRPEFLRSIRGLDVASRELQGPLWAVAAPMHEVREESRRIAGQYAGIQPLRLTVHVGEDFRHLLTGLRAIHEPFWWKMMRRGDRLGHALALGWDPCLWCSQYPEVIQPRSERMLDLAWLLDFVARRRLEGVSAGALESARQELQRHVRKWDRDAHISHFLELARQLGRPWLWTAINAPYWDLSRFDGAPSWRLLKQLLDRQGRETDMVTVRTEAEVLVALRDELARLLARWRVPIEINPSSNLLVGNLTHPLAQPLFHLDPFDRKEDRGLVLTLSADDPVSFATTLADEFAYAWAGLVVGAGEAPAYAQEWLERAARAARCAVF